MIKLLAKQKTVLETSRILEIAVYTVKSHIRNIMDKLALHTRLELAAFANVKRPLKKAFATNQNKP